MLALAKRSLSLLTTSAWSKVAKIPLVELWVVGLLEGVVAWGLQATHLVAGGRRVRKPCRL